MDEPGTLREKIFQTNSEQNENSRDMDERPASPCRDYLFSFCVRELRIVVIQINRGNKLKIVESMTRLFLVCWHLLMIEPSGEIIS